MCGHDEANKSRCVKIELASLVPENRGLALKQNQRNKIQHYAVEDQFKEKMNNSTYTNFFATN